MKGQSFGTRLKFLREKVGLSQEALARELSRRLGREQSVSSIANWENERFKHAPGTDKIQALAEIFDVSMEYLWNGKPQELKKKPESILDVLHLKQLEKFIEKEIDKKIAFLKKELLKKKN